MLVLLYSIAGALALAALAVAAWALFADRSRGRRRCPKCFHTMDPAIGLICPECGRDARDELRLFKTRRRWKMTVAAVVLLAGPALLTGGLARVKQTGGWADLPNWAMARLAWLEDADLDKELELRIVRGRLTYPQAQAVVDEARRRLTSTQPKAVTSGLSLLKKVAGNSYIRDFDDAVARPTLEDLNPQKLTDALFALGQKDPTRWPEVAELLGRLHDADERALITLIELLGHSDQRVRESAWSALSSRWRPSERNSVPRLPSPPGDAMSIVHPRRWMNGPNPRVIVPPFAQSVIDLDRDPDAIRAWAKDRWLSGVADASIWNAERLPELWLWCRLDRFGPDSWLAVEAATEDHERLVQIYAISLLTGYAWSDAVESRFIAGLRSTDEHVQAEAVNASAHFGTSAMSLLPIFLEVATSLDGALGSSGFVEQFKEMGGNPADLRDALVERLDRTYAEHRDQVRLDMLAGTGVKFSVDMLFWFLADIGLPDERAAAICEKYMSMGDSVPSLPAATAYAAMSGDKSRVTRFILDRNPDLTNKFYVNTAEERLLDLVRRGLADTDMLVAHYSEANPIQRTAFVSMLHGFIYEWRLIEPFLPWLESIKLDDTDPVMQAQAAGLIARHTKYRTQDKSCK